MSSTIQSLQSTQPYSNISGKFIESPISAFNNIISDISEIISSVVLMKIDKPTSLHKSKKSTIDCLAIDSQIFFIDKSIHIMGFFKLYMFENKMLVKVLKPGLNFKELGILANIHKNFDLISQQFFRYIMMYNRITKNFDDVPAELVNQIINVIKKRKFEKTSAYLLPFKNKLSKLEKENDWALYSKYEFIIKFRNNTYNKHFTYSIFKVLSSDIKNSTSLECIRYSECDMIKTGSVNYSHTEEFIKNLFYYGEIIKQASLEN